ncbi:MAG: ATP-binding protein [Nitrosopumilaceae archaeon]|jgi:signal transduction histidine kinase
MKSKSKVTIIIICQITLILGSFLTLAIFESQTALLGNSINVAGKNRFLASQLVDEIKDYAFLENPSASPDSKLIALEENIFLLKNGGMLNENQIPNLDKKFEKDWMIMYEGFIGLKTEYVEFKNRDTLNLTFQDLEGIELEFNSFIQSSDNLVEEMGEHVKTLADRLVLLQIILSMVNIAVHIGLIILIIKIFENEFKRTQKVEKLATIGELAARLAHDMRTPLSNLNMGLKLIDQKITEKSEREKLKIMEKATERLSHQVNDVMDFVRTKDPTLSIWNLNSILEESISTVQIPNEIKITMPEQNLSIVCDKEQFEIMFINLIKNSIESIKEKGFIKFDFEENKEEIIIKIEDSGGGIPEEYLDQIFDPLVTLKNRGTGLGLASCQNIVKIHGGAISVKNNPTTFTIILPKSSIGSKI